MHVHSQKQNCQKNTLLANEHGDIPRILAKLAVTIDVIANKLKNGSIILYDFWNVNESNVYISRLRFMRLCAHV